MLLPGCSRERKLLRDDATEYLQRSLPHLRAKDFPEAMQGYPLTGAQFRRKNVPSWLSRMRLLLKSCDIGPRTNRRASTKQRQTIAGSRARGQRGSVAGHYVWSFWGNPRELDRLLQAYAIEMCRLASRQKGYAVTEQQLPDGSVKLQILVEGS
jgi:hypothetical protein